MNLKSALLALLFCFATSAMAQNSASQPPPAGSSSNSSSQSATSSPGSQVSGSDSNALHSNMAGYADSATLQSQIEGALRNEPSLGSSHIGVRVSDDSIDLSGTVGSSKDKVTAERIAQSFDGNRKLNDTLMVTGHGHSDLAPDHSSMNNGGTGNAKNPVTQGVAATNDGSTNPR